MLKHFISLSFCLFALGCGVGADVTEDGTKAIEGEATRQCGKPVCTLYCANGFERNARGCEICACAPDPVCRPVACTLFCANGFKKDARGCDQCVCQPAPQPGPTKDAGVSEPTKCQVPACNIFCPNGFKKDANGCAVGCICA